MTNSTPWFDMIFHDLLERASLFSWFYWCFVSLAKVWWSTWAGNKPNIWQNMVTYSFFDFWIRLFSLILSLAFLWCACNKHCIFTQWKICLSFTLREIQDIGSHFDKTTILSDFDMERFYSNPFKWEFTGITKDVS